MTSCRGPDSFSHGECVGALVWLGEGGGAREGCTLPHTHSRARTHTHTHNTHTHTHAHARTHAISVWGIPFFFFVSTSVNDNVLPSGAQQVRRTPNSTEAHPTFTPNHVLSTPGRREKDKQHCPGSGQRSPRVLGTIRPVACKTKMTHMGAGLQAGVCLSASTAPCLLFLISR